MITIQRQKDKIVAKKNNEIVGEVTKAKKGYMFTLYQSNVLSCVEGLKKPFTEQEAIDTMLKYII